MSADNWTQCPKCAAVRVADLEVSKARLDLAYGVVSADAFVKMRDSAQAEEARRPEPTMREDYDIGVDNEGVFVIDYRSSCLDCGFSFEFKHSEQVEAA